MLKNSLFYHLRVSNVSQMDSWLRRILCTRWNRRERVARVCTGSPVRTVRTEYSPSLRPPCVPKQVKVGRERSNARPIRTPQPSHAQRASHFTDEIIFHVISNAQTKLEWMQNVRKWGARGVHVLPPPTCHADMHSTLGETRFVARPLLASRSNNFPFLSIFPFIHFCVLFLVVFFFSFFSFFIGFNGKNEEVLFWGEIRRLKRAGARKNCYF